MEDADLLALADREQQRLTDENDHGAAIIMRALAERLRQTKAGPRPLSEKSTVTVTLADLESVSERIKRQVEARVLAAVVDCRRTTAAVRRAFR